MAYRFERPEGFVFAAGQSIDVTLIDPPETDGEGNQRTFTLASAPYEPDLMVVTRQRDTAFKRVFKNMKPGAQIRFDGPFGSMTLHRKTARPAVFLAGGIGITPFRSILFQAIRDNTGHRMYLFYSNRLPADAAFLDELQALAREQPGFNLVATMTGLDKSKESWSGERGHIDPAMLKRYVPDLTVPIYYIAGPPAMVGAMKEVLSQAGADGDDVRSEDFAGY